MSYEGYVQALCVNGHLRTWDAYVEDYDWFASTPCSCGAPFAFRHSVDTTNDDGKPLTFEVDVPAVVRTCDMGCVHIVEETRYRIPAPISGAAHGGKA